MTRVAEGALGSADSVCERRLIGWCCIDSAAFTDALDAGMTGAALGNTGLAQIFGAMQRLAEGEVPTFTAADVIEELRRADELDTIGGTAAIHALVAAAHGTSYSGLVKKVMTRAVARAIPPEPTEPRGSHVSTGVALAGDREPAARAWSSLRKVVSDQLCCYADFLARRACKALRAERMAEARELARITGALETAAAVIDRAPRATPFAADRAGTT